MLEFNYGTVSTSRTETLAQVLDCEKDRSGHIYGIYEPNLTGFVDKWTVFRCSKCFAYVNNACRSGESMGLNGGWFCSFCDVYNEIGEVPVENEYVCERRRQDLDLEVVESVTAVVVLDCNLDVEAELEVVKNLDYQSFERICLVVIEDGGVVLRLRSGEIRFPVDNKNINKRCKDLDHEWFVRKYGLDQESVWMDNGEFSDLMAKTRLMRSDSLKRRNKRHTGLALFLASCLKPKHVVAFLFGPSTFSPGKIISSNRKNHIRQFRNIEEGRDLKYFGESTSFYKTLSKYVHAMVFISSLDQIGIWEMQPCFQDVIQYESFTDSNFLNDWNAFTRINMHTSISNIEVICSRRLLLNGILGPVSPDKPTRFCYSDTPHGVGKTNLFRFNGSMNPYPSLLLSCQVQTAKTTEEAIDQMPSLFIFQIEMGFEQNGKMYTHVASKILLATSFGTTPSFSHNFNWHISAASIAKRISYDVLYKDRYHNFELQQWIRDIVSHLRSLKSLHIPEMKNFIELSYFLQRSFVIQKRNKSPDQWILNHYLLLRSTLAQTFRLLKPEIYHNTNVNLSLTSDILNFPHPLIVDGGTFLVLRYSDPNDTTLQSLKKVADSIYNADDRFPKPSYKLAQIGSSQDRYVKSKLAPLSDHTLQTDDITLDRYTLLVESNN